MGRSGVEWGWIRIAHTAGLDRAGWRGELVGWEYGTLSCGWSEDTMGLSKACNVCGEGRWFGVWCV